MDVNAVNELRIGNYIVNNYITYSEKSTKRSVLEVTLPILNEIHAGSLKLEPIPLNHFWFKEFGFDRQKKTKSQNLPNEFQFLYVKSFRFEKKPYKFQVWSDEDGSFFSFYEISRGSIDTKNKYVHQLQNAYHNLTGQELKRSF